MVLRSPLNNLPSSTYLTKICHHLKMTTMKSILLPILAAVLVATTMSKDLGVRAPAPVTSDNCNCQCDGTTYLDENDTIQGNCKSTDSTERKWCYISQDQETMDACKDDFGYDSRYNMSKSYHACSTPDLYSEECSSFVIDI